MGDVGDADKATILDSLIMFTPLCHHTTPGDSSSLIPSLASIIPLMASRKC